MGALPLHWTDPARTFTSLEISVIKSRAFFGVADDETIELTAFDTRKKVSVAYVRNLDDQVRLMVEADRRSDVAGVYTCFNRLHPGLFARIGEGKWIPFATRASDHDVTHVRAVYLDFDAKRPRDISASDDEKRAAYDASLACEQWLASELGDDCLARGDSGNGYSLFIALEPVPPSDMTRTKIDRFLKAVSAKFGTDRVKIDQTVSNPARLCPAFGTRKRKGVDCAERPHRGTFFICRPIARRVPIEAL
ncbi:MAG TPA: hypothetical protein PLI95_19555 [Polyangiaceae bacterium]|nr:hypothetical protein [Polyangiaceae bacterium]